MYEQIKNPALINKNMDQKNQYNKKNAATSFITFMLTSQLVMLGS